MIIAQRPNVFAIIIPIVTIKFVLFIQNIERGRLFTRILFEPGVEIKGTVPSENFTATNETLVFVGPFERKVNVLAKIKDQVIIVKCKIEFLCIFIDNNSNLDRHVR